MSEKIRLQLKDDYLFFDGVKLPKHLQDRNVAGGNVQKMLERMQEAVDSRKLLGDRVLSFLEGETIAGRKFGAALDLLTIFLPFGRKINDGREAARVILERQQKKEERMQRISKWLRQPSSKAGLVVVAAILTALGVNVSPEFLGEHINQIVEGVAIAMAGLAGLYEAFRNEKTDEE